MIAQRLETIHALVRDAVGFEPSFRTTVLVDDWSGQSNGVSFGPVIYLFPTPPDPASSIGESGSWAELLAIHEFVHTAHVSRPSRNPLDRFVYGLVPFPVHPIATRAPRWVLEGYATLLEGRLTGGGRPHGTWRPTVIRQWALEGKLPPYAALNRQDGYWEGSMAYLVGSAYLEWLVERSGEDALRDLWSRLTARRRRSFDEAFAGVFGGPPEELYAAFTVDATEKALAARDRIRAAGIVEGEPFQRLETFADDPAASPDGSLLAITIEPRERPPVVVVWSTAPDTAATRRLAEQRERLLAEDPEDVPAIEWRPPPRRPLARLGPAGGRGHRAPRFLPGGDRLLVIRSEGLGDGRTRPDLFEWNWRTGALRRITHGAGIRAADPLPDGRSAIGTRCENGVCDLVRIDLATGRVDPVASGAAGEAFQRPRVSPDGRTVAAALHRPDGWRIAIVDLATGVMRETGPPDGASRYDPAWLPGGGALVVVSGAGGVFDLERIDVTTGETRPLTRVTGAALSPEPDPRGGIWFLAFRSRGHDVDRIVPAEPLERGPALESALAPAAPSAPRDAPPLALDPVPPSRGYGAGPRDWTLLPQGSIAPSGRAIGLTLASTDPVGRLVWTMDGLAGGDGAWRGAALRAAWRGFRPGIVGSGFVAREEPSSQDPVRVEGLDADYAGGALSLSLSREFPSRFERIDLGGTLGELDIDGEGDGARRLAYVDGEYRVLATPNGWRLTGGIEAHAAAGSTLDESWTRVVGGATLGAGSRGGQIRVSTIVGATGGDAPLWERFAVGGIVPPLVDSALLSQRIPFPAAPVAYVEGENVWTVRVEARGRTGLSAFWWGGTAGEELGDWKRAIGLEWVLDRAGIPYLGIPAARVEAGLARLLDAPLRKETRGWMAISFRP